METALSRFLYAGEQLDEITNLYYLRARQYNTVIGRFTQEDTYLGDGRNLYVYVHNNPLKYVDPSGHDRENNYESGKKKNPNPIDMLPWLFLIDTPSLPDVNVNPYGLIGNEDIISNNVNDINESSEKGERGGGGRPTVVSNERNVDGTVGGRKTVANRNMETISIRKTSNRNFDSTGVNKKTTGVLEVVGDFDFVDNAALLHSSVGDFTYNPKTGEVSKMKGGGHGQANIDFLEANNISYNIVYEYDNGVRIGNIPNHKVVEKRTGTNQSWFPVDWTEKDIVNAGEYVANLPGNDDVADGISVFGEYKGVRVGVIRTNGKIGTIFPDATTQP